tara:strand:- start:49 stop:720 length:672 start_codon:yes stop_codon:yes gene_type:complete
MSKEDDIVNAVGMALGASNLIKQAHAGYAKGPKRELGDFHNTINIQDDIFTKDEIQKYYDKIIFLKAEGDIDKNWIKEIWQKVKPDDLKLSMVYLNTEQSDKFHTNALAKKQYKIIVYLTPDIQPEDGGTIEFWTPNITDELKAIAVDTPYGLNQQQENNKDIIKAYWPQPGRMIIFDSRIPYVERNLISTSKKTRISLVFECDVLEKTVEQMATLTDSVPPQ